MWLGVNPEDTPEYLTLKPPQRIDFEDLQILKGNIEGLKGVSTQLYGNRFPVLYGKSTQPMVR